MGGSSVFLGYVFSHTSSVVWIFITCKRLQTQTSGNCIQDRKSLCRGFGTLRGWLLCLPPGPGGARFVLFSDIIFWNPSGVVASEHTKWRKLGAKDNFMWRPIIFHHTLRKHPVHYCWTLFNRASEHAHVLYPGWPTHSCFAKAGACIPSVSLIGEQGTGDFLLTVILSLYAPVRGVGLNQCAWLYTHQQR